MNKHIITPLFLLTILCTGFAAEPNWRVIQQPGPEQSPTVIGFTVQDFGAKGDGATDDTTAFQQALDAMAALGGGVVYAPTGRYALRNTLTIPRGVTLCGDWKNPTQNPEIGGTILKVLTGKGKEDGPAFISMKASAGLKNIALWHPEQNASKIVPYPYAVEQIPDSQWNSISHNVTLENITLVNAYQGFKAGPENNCLHYLHHVYGTPLKTGIFIHHCTDIGRIENLHFSPDFWIQSGLSNAPKFVNKLRNWLQENGTALHIIRSDWEYSSFIQIDGYKTGLYVTKGEFYGGNAQFYALDITDCDTAFHIEQANSIGYAFANSQFKGNRFGILTGETYGGPILMHDCVVSGGEKAILFQGRGRIGLQHCTLEKGDISVEGGTLSLVDSDLTDNKSTIRLEHGCVAATLIGNRFAGGKPRIKQSGKNENIIIDHSPMEFAKLQELKRSPKRGQKPAKNDLFVVTAATDGSSDATTAIQTALDKAGKNGGGIVYLPAGYYMLKGHLTVPVGVELRGSHEVPFHNMAKGTTLLPYAGKDDANGTPTVTLLEKSGIRGLAFYYPEQAWPDFTPYPFTIQGKGADIYVIHVSGVNMYQFVDFKTHRCDRHFVDYLAGCPLRTGIQVGGGSENGVVANVQFNPHYWMRTTFDDELQKELKYDEGIKFNSIWLFQKHNLDALWFGDCVDQLQFENFVFGSKFGLFFDTENGRSSQGGMVLGHGTDGSRVSLYVKAATGKPLSLINSKLVAMDHMESKNESHNTTDKKYIWIGKDVNAEVHMFNTMMWGDPDDCALIENGRLVMQLAAYLQHGNGYIVENGGLDMINNHMQQPGNHLSFDTLSQPVRLIGCSMAEGLEINNEVKPEKCWISDDGMVELLGVAANNDVRSGR
ncbi:MAG: hypothetical protein DRP64_09570 [Verrucomicrobia bacterium]|nr:MAG: hypothetical protein DRP64_09570 [Verrucomicrobiota bacterium]